MPSYILKTARDSDEYVWWSDIVEAPLAIGTRNHITNAMVRTGRKAEEWACDRFERADETGTSALWPSADDPAYGWDDGTLIAEQRGILRRELLAEYTRRRLAGDPTVFGLLEPFEDAAPASTGETTT